MKPLSTISHDDLLATLLADLAEQQRRGLSADVEAVAGEHPELAGVLIEEGFLSYNDITCTDAAGLAEFSGLNEEQSDEVVMYAEEYTDVMDQSVESERRQAEEDASKLAVEQAEA